MTAEQSHRSAITGDDPDGGHRTIILWREADLIEGRVVRRVVVTLDATMATATVLRCPEAVEVGRGHAGGSPGVHRRATGREAVPWTALTLWGI